MATPEFPHSSPDAIQRDVRNQRAAQGDEGVTGDTKYGKAEVNYRPAGSSNTRCERCSHFSWMGSGRGACRLVAGTIDPGYVCDKFTSGGPGLVDLVTGEATH